MPNGTQASLMLMGMLSAAMALASVTTLIFS